MSNNEVKTINNIDTREPSDHTENDRGVRESLEEFKQNFPNE
jgi:hypothetical protein